MLLLEQPGVPALKYLPTELTARSATITWTIDYNGNSAISGYEIQYKQIFLTSKQQLDYSSSSKSLAAKGNQSLILSNNHLSDQTNLNNPNNLTDQDLLFKKLRKESSDDEFWNHQANIQFVSSNEVQESSSLQSTSSNLQSINNLSAKSNLQLIGQFNLNKLEPSNLYLIRLRAQNQIGFSKFSNTIFILTKKESPSIIPQNVTCSSLNSRSIRVSWQIPRHFSTDKKIQTNLIGQRISHQVIEGIFLFLAFLLFFSCIGYILKSIFFL